MEINQSNLSISSIQEMINKLRNNVPHDDISILNELQKHIRYPQTYFRVDCDDLKTGLPKCGFYPVGRGLWNNEDRIINGKSIMVLGQDFGGYEGYSKSIQDGEESVNGPTWRNLLKLLDDAKIDLANVFFTNAVMGQRKKGLSSIKNDVWAKEKVFMTDNLNFLKMQILLQRPKVILVLGKEAFPILQTLHPALKDLKSSMSFLQLDSPSNFMKFNQSIKFDEIPDYSFKLVFLVHPSYRHLNVKRRTFAGKIGHEAELELIKRTLN